MKYTRERIIVSIKCLCYLVCVFCLNSVDCYCPKWAEKPLESRVYEATIVLRAAVFERNFENKFLDLSLVSVYRGGRELVLISQYGGSPYNTTDRQVKLKISNSLVDCFTWNNLSVDSSQLVVFAHISDPTASLETTPSDGPWLEATAAAVPWTFGVDIAIWSSVGWAGWGGWGPCSATCNGGVQLRSRTCARPPCEGFGQQKRKCNFFRCKGAVNPLASNERKIFHPTQAHWTKVVDRPNAFSLKPNSYIWISSSQVFSERADRGFPKEFTLFVTLRLRPESGGFGQGTLFSLRSRHRSGAFLSLELAGKGLARLVHSVDGVTKTIYMTVTLHDFRWHHIAISVHDDSTVRIYVDCRWLRTDVLGKNALNTPRDADLIIGYLFSGDLEQLMIIPNANIASQQCSSTEEPVYMDTIQDANENIIDVT